MSMVQNTGMVNTNLFTGVSIVEFRDGPCTLFSFNLALDYDYTVCQETTGGNVNLDIKFLLPTPHPINVVVYGTFDTLIEITKHLDIIRTHV